MTSTRIKLVDGFGPEPVRARVINTWRCQRILLSRELKVSAAELKECMMSAGLDHGARR